MFSSLKLKAFRIYWLGMFISLIGTWIQIVAQSWLVFQLTKSEFLLGLVGFLTHIPVFFLSLFGGVMADRANRKVILMVTQVSFMLMAFVLAFLTQRGLITPLQIMFIAVLNGIIMAFDAPSRQAVVVNLVDKKNLLNAIALNSVAFNSSRIIGPVLAGILVAVIGMSGCFYVNAFSFTAMIIALALIQINGNPLNNKNHGPLKDLCEGLSAVKNNRQILILMSMVAVSSLFGIPYIILMPVFADNILKVGISGLGYLMSFSGVGAVVGALILAGLGDFKFKGKLLGISMVIFAFSLILLSLSRNYAFSFISLAFIGASSVTAVSLINTILQGIVTDEIRGRVMSVFMFTFAGFMPFGNLLAGSLAQVFGVSQALLINGIICAIFFLSLNLFYPKIKNL
ncbi:MAG: MFS transporter [Candidatus Omnitrophota bacterium]|nr:MAG: MFS transporter [Candidatus Omnitrophota bacterium]